MASASTTEKAQARGYLATVFLATMLLFSRAPLPLDTSAWYVGRSYAVLSLLALSLIVSAYFSLGGKPLFGKALLDD